MQKNISIKGAREHNLKNVDVEIPRDTLTVLTGLSASGKSRMRAVKPSQSALRPGRRIVDRLGQIRIADLGAKRRVEAAVMEADGFGFDTPGPDHLCIPQRWTVTRSTARKTTLSTARPIRITVSNPAKTLAISSALRFS